MDAILAVQKVEDLSYIWYVAPGRLSWHGCTKMLLDLRYICSQQATPASMNTQSRRYNGSDKRDLGANKTENFFQKCSSNRAVRF